MASIKRGDEGIEVTLLQGVLLHLGHELEADGRFGEKTAAAVERFQRETGLEVDGKAGDDTIGALITALWNSRDDGASDTITFTDAEARAIEAGSDEDQA